MPAAKWDPGRSVSAVPAVLELEMPNSRPRSAHVDPQGRTQVEDVGVVPAVLPILLVSNHLQEPQRWMLCGHAM